MFTHTNSNIGISFEQLRNVNLWKAKLFPVDGKRWNRGTFHTELVPRAANYLFINSFHKILSLYMLWFLYHNFWTSNRLEEWIKFKNWGNCNIWSEVVQSFTEKGLLLSFNWVLYFQECFVRWIRCKKTYCAQYSGSRKVILSLNYSGDRCHDKDAW